MFRGDSPVLALADARRIGGSGFRAFVKGDLAGHLLDLGELGFQADYVASDFLYFERPDRVCRLAAVVFEADPESGVVRGRGGWILDADGRENGSGRLGVAGFRLVPMIGRRIVRWMVLGIGGNVGHERVVERAGDCRCGAGHASRFAGSVSVCELGYGIVSFARSMDFGDASCS
jgi:hypothetical protein